MAGYHYLFPFEKVDKGSEIIIYGAGELGQEYLKQIEITKYCNVKCFIDRSFKDMKSCTIPVYGRDKIRELKFDYIVLAFQSKGYLNDIVTFLQLEGVSLDKIIFTGYREYEDSLSYHIGLDVKLSKLAFFNNPEKVSISMRFGGGLGDCIIIKKFFEELMKLIPSASVDIYVPHTSEYIKGIYGDERHINYIIDNPYLYKKYYAHYDLALYLIDILNIDFIGDKLFDKIDCHTAKIINHAQQVCLQYKLKAFPSTNRRTHFERMLFMKLNCYTAYNHFGLVNIKDKDVEIKLLEKWKKQFLQLSLGKYISINYGNGTGTGASKQWPYEYFCMLVNELRKEYPEIKIVQVGGQECKKVKNVDKYFMGKNLELVKYILRDSLLHIDIEGGLVHLATQLGTKCIVLFGPTPLAYYGYKDNINIVSKKCNGCFALYDNIYQCAKGIEKAECMYSIKPNMVMNEVKNYFKGINNE